jgi:FkbM family methyltransferase
MKLKTANYLQKLIVSKLFNEKYYHRIKLAKIIFDYRVGRDYENCKRLFHQIIEKDSVVLDIGANMGQYACRLSDYIKTGKIYSFEPFYPNYTSLCSMKKTLRLKNVEPLHIAVSDKKGALKLMIPIINDNLIVGTQAVLEQFRHSDYKNVKYCEETVAVETIDNFVAEKKLSKIDFIKIDTEGAEIAVLNGGLETIKKHLPVLSIEISPSSSELNFLYAMGYESFFMSDKKLVPFDQNGNKDRLSGNLILINKTKRSL